jgi:hypothetical protein
MNINVKDFVEISLPILAKGMLGIFFVIGIILLCTVALNAVFKD